LDRGRPSVRSPDGWEWGEIHALALRVALARLGDRGAAEDAAQETALRLWRFRDALERAADPEAWIVRVSTNEASRLRERRSRTAGREKWIEDVPSGELTREPAEDPVLRATVMSELRRLADQDRTIVALHYFGDVSLPDVARRLDMPLGTVKARLSRARKRLGNEFAA
jgi:RNA polymerase sigma-70 factor (ECF subfamily)